MKVQQVRVKQYKVLQDLAINLDGKSILLAGDNGVGKSSFLQFVQIALGIKKPLAGTDANGYVVALKDGKELTFRVKNGIISVEVDGIKDSRKGTIAGIVGDTAFDIDEFIKLSESAAGRKKQVEIFKKLLPQDIQAELAKYEQDVDKMMEQRRDVGRDRDRLKGAMQESQVFTSEPTKIDVAELSNQLSQGIAKNQLIIESETKHRQVQDQAERISQQIVDLQNQLNELQQKDESMAAWLAKNPRIDLGQLEQQMRDADAINAKHREWERSKALENEFTQYQTQYGNLTDQIEQTRKLIKDTTENCGTPVAGLEFDDDGLIYNGIRVHIDSLATSEIIELGIKMKMAENPDLGILFIEHTESLGQDRMQMLLDIAAQHDWQIMAEEVRRGVDKLRVEFLVEQE